MLRRLVYLWHHRIRKDLHDDGSAEQPRVDSTFVRRDFQLRWAVPRQEKRTSPPSDSQKKTTVCFQLLRSDRLNSYEVQSEADILLERQRKEIQLGKNNQRAK